jgi:ankyrin repeat protein
MYSTALQVAAYHGHEEIVRTLIANGANVRLKGGDCDTALQAAALRGNEKIVDILFDCHADLGSEGGRFGTALVAAASSGHGSIVSKLLNANISIHTINFKSKYRSTALEAAALKGYQRIVEELLQVGADHGSAIMEAAQRDHEEVVQIFIKHGAKLNVPYSKHESIYLDRYEPFFTSRGSDHPISENTMSILELVVANNGSDKLVKELLQAGASAERSSRQVLTSAAYRGQLQKFKLLIAAGARIDSSCDKLLKAAIHEGWMTTVDEALQAGVNATSDMFRTATKSIHPVSDEYHTNGEIIAEKLIRSGMSVDVKDESLIIAVSGGYEKLVSMLLQAGADIHRFAPYTERGMERVTRLLPPLPTVTTS